MQGSYKSCKCRELDPVLWKDAVLEGTSLQEAGLLVYWDFFFFLKTRFFKNFF